MGRQHSRSELQGQFFHGPFGRFSHVLHAEEDDLVFIAGWVVITLLLGMLRSMRDIGDWRMSC